MSGQNLSYASVSDIISAALGKTLGAANSLPTELQNTALIRELDDICNEFLDRGRVMMKKPFWWMEEFYPFNTYDRTTISALTAGVSTSGTIASSTGWPSAGRFFIEDSNGAVDFIDFTNRSGAALTITAATIGVDHSADSNAELLYVTPDNFGELISLTLDRVPYYPLDPVPEVLPNNPYFTFNGKYLLFPREIGSHVGTLRYWKSATVLSSGDEATDLQKSTNIPLKYRRFAEFKLAGHISNVRRRYDMEDRFNAKAEAILMQAVQLECNLSASPFDTIGPSW